METSYRETPGPTQVLIPSNSMTVRCQGPGRPSVQVQTLLSVSVPDNTGPVSVFLCCVVRRKDRTRIDFNVSHPPSYGLHVHSVQIGLGRCLRWRGREGGHRLGAVERLGVESVNPGKTRGRARREIRGGTRAGARGGSNPDAVFIGSGAERHHNLTSISFTTNPIVLEENVRRRVLRLRSSRNGASGF